MFSIVIVRMNRKIRKQENATKIYGYFFFLLKIKQVLYKLNGWIDDMKHDMIFCWTNIFSEECFSYTYNNPASNVNKCLDLFCFSFSFSGNKNTMLMRNKNKENNYVKRIKQKKQQNLEIICTGNNALPPTNQLRFVFENHRFAGDSVLHWTSTIIYVFYF